MFTRLLDMDRTLSFVDELHRQMDRTFDDVYGGRWERRPLERARQTFPAMTLTDNGDGYVLKADLPGLTDKDISLEIAQDVLTIKGARKHEVPEGASVHRRERPQLTFSKSVTLPSKIDAEKVQAVIENGVLTIQLAKADEVKPRRIAVASA
jgi:HSP20 family protein